MKKIIQFLITLILLTIFSLIIIFVFNPADLRTKLIGSILNSYLSSKIENYQPLSETNNAATGVSTDKNPLLNPEQEAAMESFGVDVAQLPSEITPAMETCFMEKLGQARAMEIVNGATPGLGDFLKAGDCLGK